LDKKLCGKHRFCAKEFQQFTPEILHHLECQVIYSIEFNSRNKNDYKNGNYFVFILDDIGALFRKRHQFFIEILSISNNLLDDGAF
jgi:hypothetical protein